MREKRFTRNAIHNNDRLFLLEIFEWKGLGVPHIWWYVAHENDARNCFLSWCNDIQRNNVSKWKFHRRERRKILKLQQPLLNNVCVHCTKFARMERFFPGTLIVIASGFFSSPFYWPSNKPFEFFKIMKKITSDNESFIRVNPEIFIFIFDLILLLLLENKFG